MPCALRCRCEPDGRGSLSHNKTHTEIRNEAENRELIEITDEMQSAMQEAFEAVGQGFGSLWA